MPASCTARRGQRLLPQDRLKAAHTETDTGYILAGCHASSHCTHSSLLFPFLSIQQHERSIASRGIAMEAGCDATPWLRLCVMLPQTLFLCSVWEGHAGRIPITAKASE